MVFALPKTGQLIATLFESIFSVYNTATSAVSFRRGGELAHPNKHIREAIQYAEHCGWTFVKAGPRSHLYGRLFCPRRDPNCDDI